MKFILLLFLSFSTYAQTQTVEVFPEADTYVSQNEEKRSRGNESILDLGNYHASSRALMKFDEENLKQILKDKVIVSATLELPIALHYIHKTGTIGLHKLNQPWQELSATWICSNDTNSSHYQSACEDEDKWLMWSHDPNNVISYPYDISPFSTTTIEKNQVVPLGFDISIYIQELLEDSAVNNGFAIYKNSTDINSPLKLHSKESEIKPKLILRFKDKVVVSSDVEAKLNSNIKEGLFPFSVNFDASLSKVNIGELTELSLDFGDGESTILNKENPIISHEYKSEGEFTAVLTVKNSEGTEAQSVINISSQGTVGTQIDNNYSYVISPDEQMKIDYKNGEEAIIVGDICKVWRSADLNNNPSCHWIDNNRLSIQAFYPDMTNEVTSSVKITQTGHKKTFEYKTPEIDQSDLNSFIIMIGETDPQYIRRGQIRAKLDRRIKILSRKITYLKSINYKESIISILENVVYNLEQVLTKIDNKNAKQPTVLAQYNLPLQVNNIVSSSRYYSTMMGGFRLELSSDIGNMIEGDKAQIKSRITNINYSKQYYSNVEGYSINYKFKSDPLISLTEESFPIGKSHEYKFIDSQKSNFNDLHNYSFEIKENYKWWSRKLASSKYFLPVIEDTIAPVWESMQNGVIYAQEFPSVLAKVSDGFGKIDISSLSVSSQGTETKVITDLFETSTPNRGAEFLIKGNPSSALTAEGSYQILFSIKDNKGQDAIPNPYIAEFEIDRTKPVISTNLTENILTNNPILQFDLTSTDTSPVNSKVYLNDELKVEVSGELNQISLTLAEGQNKIEIKSVDAAGNESEIFIKNDIVLDTIAPVLTDISPADGAFLRSLDFTIAGKSNEALSKVYLDEESNELPILSDTLSFSKQVMKQQEGAHSLEITLVDLAGNESTSTFNIEISLKLIRINLVSIDPLDGRLYVRGLPGSARPGIEIEINGGFFNSSTVTVANDGSFEKDFSYADSFKLSASLPAQNLSESYDLAFEADTTFSGMIKDINGNPIPGVKVEILTSNQSSVTDGNGVFSITEPITGDHRVCIDGTTVPEEYTQGKIAYSKTFINVSLGNLQRNIIDRPIYLAPIDLENGVDIVADTAIIVTSQNAPGVEIDIPANSVEFPSGVVNKISIAEVPIERTSIEVLEFSRPDKVYALEPSGVSFKERVKLTLPNPNDFAIGTELVIMSKNSETGLWEADGAAQVVDNGDIETLPGNGISHFSEVYASPYGLKLDSYSPEYKAGIDNAGGGVKHNVNLPTYKVLGKDVGPSLTYNSNWANPRVVVTNVINTPREYIRQPASQTQGSFWGTAKVTGTVESWTRPEYIETDFVSGPKQVAPTRFDAVNAPDKSVVSYAVDFSDVDSGVLPAQANYVLQYKFIRVSRVQIRTRSAWGSVRTKRINDRYEQLMDLIYPPSLQTQLYHDNERTSPFGVGWSANLAQKIINPEDDRIMVKTQSGNYEKFVVDDVVESISSPSSHVSSFFLSEKINSIIDNNVFQSNDFLNQSTFFEKEDLTFLGYGGFFLPDFSGTTFGSYTASEYLFQSSSTPLIKRAINLDGNIFTIDDLNTIRKHSNQGVTKVLNLIKPISFSTGRPLFQFFRSRVNSSDRSSYYNDSTMKNIFSNYHNVDLSSFNVVKRVIANRRFTSNINSEHISTLPSGSVTIRKGFLDSSVGDSMFNNLNDIISFENFLLVSDTGNNRIRKIDLENDQVNTFAGNGQTYDNGDGKQAIDASIYHPTALAKDQFGNIFVSSERGYIRMIDPSGKIQTIAGKPVSQGGVFENRAEMKEMYLNNPQGLAYDEKNSLLYVADTDNHRVLRLDLSNGIASTVLGTSICTAGDIAEGKSALDVSICSPRQIKLDQSGSLVYLDSINNRVRKVNFSSSGDGKKYFNSTTDDGTKLIKNNDGSFTKTYKNGSIDQFDSLGKQIESSDVHGNTTSMIYNGAQLSSITDAKGGTTTLSYNGSLISSITDPASRTTYFTHDSNGHLISVGYPDGSTEAFFYNDKGMMERRLAKDNGETLFTYNEQDKLAELQKPDGSIEKFHAGLSDTVSAGSYDVVGMQELKNYNNEENELQDVITNAKGIETIISKDSFGQITKITGQDDKVTTIERDDQQRPVKITQADESYTTFKYNEFGDLIEKFDSEIGKAETYIYNDRGNLIKSTDIHGRTQEIFYDNATQKIIQQKNPLGQSVFNSYLDDGSLEYSSNDSEEKVSYFYDEYGNTSSKQAPTGEVVSYVRDDAGNIIEKTDPTGARVLYTYDEFNRLTSIANGVSSTDPIGKLTSYFYSDAGDLIKIIDPKQNESLFEYDLLGRLTKKTTPLGQVYEYDYDSTNNLVYEKDPNGNETSYTYDEKEQLISKVLSDNSYAFVYDDDGNILNVSNNDTSIDFTYEKIEGSYFVSTYKSSGTNLPTLDLDYSYDNQQRLENITSPFGSFSYGYDELDRVTSINNHKSENFGFNYDSSGRVTAITRPGSSTEISYDKSSFITNITHKKSASIILDSITQTKDLLGNKTSVTSSRGISTYSYDARSQLKTVSNSELTGTAYAVEAFNYDDLGNKTNDTLGSYTYDSKSKRLMQDFKYNYTYDNNGNMTSRQEKNFAGKVTNFDYTSENQLKLVTRFDGLTKLSEVSYRYDALKRRVEKKYIDYQNSSDSFVKRYTYEGDSILAEYNESNEVMAVYTHSPLRIDDTLAVDVKAAGVGKVATSSGSFFYLKDSLGSVTDVINTSGNLIQHISYSSFGKIIKIVDGAGADITSSPIHNPFYTFTNREYDNETQMYYYRARYYIPEIGRFIQEDPHPGTLTNPLERNNRYGYVKNNPTNLIDPNGEFAILGSIGALFGGQGFWDQVNEALESDVVRIALIVAAAYFTGGAAGALFTSTTIGGIAGGIVGGIAGGLAGGLHAQYSGDDPLKWAQIGQTIGGIVGSYAGTQAAGTDSATSRDLASEANSSVSSNGNYTDSVSTRQAQSTDFAIEGSSEYSLNSFSDSSLARNICYISTLTVGLIGTGYAVSGATATYSALIAGAAVGGPVGILVVGIGLGTFGFYSLGSGACN